MNDYRNMNDGEKERLARKRINYAKFLGKELHTVQQNLALLHLSSAAILIIESHPDIKFVQIESPPDKETIKCNVTGLWDENRELIANKNENRHLLEPIQRIIDEELSEDAVKGLTSGMTYDLFALAEMEYNIG